MDLGGHVTALAAGTAHACAVVDGGALCFGSESYGELGSLEVGVRRVPVEVLLS